MSHPQRGFDVINWRWRLGSLARGFATIRARAADTLLDNVNGGFFREPMAWFGGMPGMSDLARFETACSNSFKRAYGVEVNVRSAFRCWFSRPLSLALFRTCGCFATVLAMASQERFQAYSHWESSERIQ
jgi:hypothetical protein